MEGMFKNFLISVYDLNRNIICPAPVKLKPHPACHCGMRGRRAELGETLPLRGFHRSCSCSATAMAKALKRNSSSSGGFSLLLAQLLLNDKGGLFAVVLRFKVQCIAAVRKSKNEPQDALLRQLKRANLLLICFGTAPKRQNCEEKDN